MKRKWIIAMLSVMVTGASAQTEVNDSVMSGRQMDVDEVNTPLADSSLYARETFLKPMMPPLKSSDNALKLTDNRALYDTRRGDWQVNTLNSTVLFNPWRGAYVGVSGWADSMPGLLDRESGSLTLYQNLGRWSFSASAMADKYRYVGMGYLETRYGVGGTVGYQLSNAVSLHAFGYYYGRPMTAGPAVSPYLSTGTYGGYADIRFSKYWGTDLGVQRYLNPMTGKWVTDPIVRPYYKIGGKQKIGIDIGHLLKGFIWGNQGDMKPRGPVRVVPTPQQQGRR
jgi:hypothetical protein